MPKKTYKPEEIVAKLRQADVLIAQGEKIPDVRWFRLFGQDFRLAKWIVCLC